MVSHKQRVQRKLKKDVRRRVQASRTTQRSTPVNKNEELLKLMMMMNGNKQQNADPNDILRMKEINARMKSDQEKQRKGYEAEIQKIKNEAEAAVEGFKTEIEHLKKENEEAAALLAVRT